MAEDWRSLVGRTMDSDIARRGQARINLRPVLDSLRKRDAARTASTRASASASRGRAETAVYENYPEKALGALGMEAPEGGGTGGVEGMRATKTVRGKTTYEAPGVLDENSLADIYADFLLKIETANNDPRSRMMGAEPIKRPTYREFVEQNFPEYVNMVRNKDAATTGGSDPFVAATIERLKALGKTDSEVIKLIKSSQKYKDVDITEYGLKKGK